MVKLLAEWENIAPAFRQGILLFRKIVFLKK
jgi:hypothetical protein